MEKEKKIAIEVSNLSKTFYVPHEKSTTLKHSVLSFFKKKSFTKYEVLKNISFKVYEGEFFGIIGRNGSGKSTLLKMLAGIYSLDSGNLKINGKISPFLELGVGFNPELTGRDNIYLNGAILGLSKKEIDEKFDEIVSFSELVLFLDQKLKNYSSGMQVRLAFSVAIHAHAPIILLDEVLAVGDANFQRKCADVFLKIKKEKKTIVFVSHSMEAIKKFCDRVILIDKGEIIEDGKPNKVSYEYERLNLEESNYQKKQKAQDNQWGSRDVEITNVRLLSKGKETTSLQTNENTSIEIFYKNNTNKKLAVNLSAEITVDGVRCFDASTYYNKLFYINPNENKKIAIFIERLLLLPNMYGIKKNIYSLNLTLFGKDLKNVYHSWPNVLGFEVVDIDNKIKATGICNLKYKWEKYEK